MVMVHRCIFQCAEYGWFGFKEIDGDYKGRIFVRSVKGLKTSNVVTSPWTLLGIDTTVPDIPQSEPGEMNKGGIDSE